MPTVLIAPGPLRGKPGRFREILQAAGFDEFIEYPGDGTLNEAQLRESLPRCEAMLAGGELLSAEILDLAPHLRAIARTGVGYDAVDIAAATARKIPVIITPGTNQESVAEHTLGLLLAVTRNLVVNDNLVKSGGWTRALIQPVRGRTLGLVGLGRIGRAVAVRASAFGMKIIAFDPLGADTEFDTRHGIGRRTFDELLAESDVVSLHLPLSPATRAIINRETLAKMKPGSILVNTSRGGLVNEADLYASLVSGHLFGAGLDVLVDEPPDPKNPLLTLSNVVISPHLGGIDTKSMADMADLASSCVAMLRRGEWPAGCVVNDELSHGWKW
ncbi:MAG: phosphoglycerate dehydrogenase [Isosphaeraceae bacterium]